MLVNFVCMGFLLLIYEQQFINLYELAGRQVRYLALLGHFVPPVGAHDCSFLFIYLFFVCFSLIVQVVVESVCVCVCVCVCVVGGGGGSFWSRLFCCGMKVRIFVFLNVYCLEVCTS